MTNTRRYEKCLVRSTKEVRKFARLKERENIYKKKRAVKQKVGGGQGKVGAAVRHLFFVVVSNKKKRDGQLFSLEEMGSLLPTTTSSFESPQSA